MSFVSTIDAMTQSLSRMRRGKAPAGTKPIEPGIRRRIGRVKGFDTADRDELAEFISLHACKRAGRDGNAAILLAMKEAAEIAISTHGAFDGPRPEISIVDQTASDIEALRADPRGYEVWVNGMIQMLTCFARHLPDSIGRDRIGLTAEAIGLTVNARHMMGEIALMLMAQKGPVSVAIKPWARAVTANIKGLRGARLGQSAGDVFPSERRLEMSSWEIAHDAFRDTPLLAMLSVHVPVPVPMTTRFEHMNFTGPSGSGKTQKLQLMLTHDLPRVEAGGLSVVLFDTDGTLSAKVLAYASRRPRLAERVVVIDPARPDMRPQVNLMDLGRELLCYAIEALGERFTDRQSLFFDKVASAMKCIPNARLDTLIKFLSEEDFAHRYLGEFPPNVAEFVRDRLFSGNYTSTREAVIDRLSSLRDIETIGGMFDADRTALDTRSIIDQGSLFIVRINRASEAEGGLGRFAKLATRFYLASVVLAIRSRDAMAKNMPALLYLDEIADMVGGGSDQFLEEFFIQARKKSAGAIIAYQTLSQLEGSLKAIALGNTSIKIAGKVEAGDRTKLAENMDCGKDLFRAIRKTKTHGQVACVVNGVIDSAVLCRFPFLALEGLPKGNAEQVEDLMDAQRKRWAAPPKVKAVVNETSIHRDDSNVISPFRGFKR